MTSEIIKAEEERMKNTRKLFSSKLIGKDNDEERKNKMKIEISYEQWINWKSNTWIPARRDREKEND